MEAENQVSDWGMRGLGKVRMVRRGTREVRSAWMPGGCNSLEVETTSAKFVVSLLRQLGQLLRVSALAPAYARSRAHWFDCEQFPTIPMDGRFGYGNYGSFRPSALCSRICPSVDSELRREKG